MVDPGLGHGRRLGQREDRGAEGLDALGFERGKGLEPVDRAGDLEDNLVRHLGEDLADLQQFLDAVPVDLHHHRLVGKLEIGFDQLDHRAVGLSVLVEYHRIGDDAGDPQRHPFF